MVDENFRLEDIWNGEVFNPRYQYLPIDTKYFPDMELQIIALFDNLDEALDGWLIKSENYQALRTILPKFRERVQTIYIDPPFNKEQDADYFYSVKYKDSTWITLLENRLQLARDLLKDTGSILVRCDYNGNMYVRLLMNEIFGEENFRNEISVRRFKKNVTEKEIKKLPEGLDTIYLYSTSEKFSYINPYKLKSEKRKGFWRHMGDSSGQGSPKIFFGKELAPPEGKHWKYSQEKINQMIDEKKLILECRNCGYIHDKNKGSWQGCPKCGIDDPIPKYWVEERIKEVLDSNWSDIYGYSTTWDFPTENSEILLKRVIESTSNEGDLVMDFFLGCGTTTAVAHKLKRKWIGVEVGEHFYTRVLPRMKKVLFYDRSGISKEKDVRERYNEHNAGGFFKYYELEQYENTLRRTRYLDDDSFTPPKWEDPCQYLFIRDPKMSEALEVDLEQGKVKVDLGKLYENIDLPETLSNLRGKLIKRIYPDPDDPSKPAYVEFTDGEKIDLKNLDWRLIKPLIWW
jgi:adenine specific DNA methylase Mod